MADRPQGRKTGPVGGTGSVNRRGGGLGGGPAGSKGGFARRNTSVPSSGGSGYSSSPNRAIRRRGGIGGGSIIVIAIIIFVAVKFFGAGSCNNQVANIAGNFLGGGSYVSGSSLLNLLGGQSYSTSSNDYNMAMTSYPSGSGSAVLNTNVAYGSRSKYTDIRGNGSDTVTIMVYMCGTDLESKSGMASGDISEMCRASLASNVNVLIYTGGCKEWKTSGISNRVNQIYKIENGSLVCLESDMGNLSMTDPSTLTAFIKYCTANYPANRQDLIFWDHGGGSISGYGYDEKFGSGSMTLSGINTALKNAGTKFDFIGFDACLMATLENALMLSNYADYMIASEETEPGVGWYYTNWLTQLSSDTSMSTIEIGRSIVDDFINVCDQKCRGQKTTLSVVDLAELESTVPDELTTFSEATRELITNDGYKTVSNARYNTKEFSKNIDQIDLVHFANLLGTTESKELANALLSCVKYNRSASCVSNANGLSIYFPYQKASKVNQVVNTYNAIGMDSEYAKCITEFASLEVGGQMSTGGNNNAYTSLNGGSYSTGTSSFTGISSLLSSLYSGGSTSSYASGFNSGSLLDLFRASEVDSDRAAAYISNNYFDASNLVWTKSGNNNVISLPESQWELVHSIDLNVFVDDGTGYIDLGLDNIYDYDSNGNLIGAYDNSWVSINGQIVAYYHTDSNAGTYSGYVPALINGQRAEIYITFDDSYPNGYITGAKYIYDDATSETSAKEMFGLSSGDKLDFICDYYDYNGKFSDTYYLGEQMVLSDTIELGRMYIDSKKVNATFLFTDIYNQDYWTPVMP